MEEAISAADTMVACAACVVTALDQIVFHEAGLHWHHAECHKKTQYHVQTAEDDALHRPDSSDAELLDAAYNRKRLNADDFTYIRQTSNISTGSFDQRTCAIMPDIEKLITHGVDLHYYECPICAHKYSKKRSALDDKGTYKVYRFVQQADLEKHICQFHDSKKDHLDVKTHASILRTVHWNGLGTKNNDVLNSASFHYDPKLKQDQLPTCDVDDAKQQQQADKKKLYQARYSMRVNKVDVQIFLAAHPELAILADSAMQVVMEALQEKHGVTFCFVVFCGVCLHVFGVFLCVNEAVCVCVVFSNNFILMYERHFVSRFSYVCFVESCVRCLFTL